MRSIFTFKKRGLFMLSFVVALLAGGGSSAMAAINQSFKGPEGENAYPILNSLGWELEDGRWKFYGAGIYDYDNATANTDLITPKISASSNLQTITITGYSGSDDVRLKAYISTDEKQSWTELEDLTEKIAATGWSAEDITTKEFSVEGDYYVKLECFYVFFTNFKSTDIYEIPNMAVYSDAYGSTATSGRTNDFGLVNAAPSYTYYVKNTERGVLTVEAEVTGGYTVSSSMLSLEAGQQQAITVTAPMGDSEGTLTITGKNGEEVIKTFTANFKGDVMDKEGKFFEDFVDDYRPVTSSDLPGWELDLSVTGSTDGFGRLMFYNSTLYEYANTNESKYAITPKLSVKGENEKFYFNAYKRNGSSDAMIAVSYSADKENWTSVKTFSYYNFSTSAQTFSFNGIPAGNYYVKFEICDVAIDWVYGFNYASEATVLDETVAAEGLTAGVQDVTLKYTAKAGWNTIALPFAVEDLSVFGADAKAYAFNGYADGNISFTPATALEAGKPYVLYVGEVAEANGNFEFQQVNVEATEAAEVAFGGATFKATYAPVAKGEMTDKYGITPDGHVKKGSSNASMKGFRGYFELPAAGARIVIDGQEVTAIEGIETKANTVETIYNLNGQQLTKPQRGINIINGRKVVVK